MRRVRVLAVIAACVAEPYALAQYTQQAKLVGTGAIGHASRGSSCALSADGNTALVGGNTDNQLVEFPDFGDGAVWVWTRSGGVWSQQAKLADASEEGGLIDQGWSVALSADGNTALVGAPTDTGRVKVWTRAGTTWSLQATLIGTGITSFYEFQGTSVALSADGNTAIVGAVLDDSPSLGAFGVGAAWVFTRTAGDWTQQGGKLVGSGAVGASDQGLSVALSADGNTAMVGGDLDNNGAGAVWVWTRSSGVWTQQGPKLTGLPAKPTGGFGSSLALSADGNTAVIGAHDSFGAVGALYPFTRSAGVWTQQTAPLVGSGFAGFSEQGISIALSADGNTALLGGSFDADNVGAAWIFTRSGGAWKQQGVKIVGSGEAGDAGQSWRVAISGDGLTALVGGPLDASGDGAAWVFIATKPAIFLPPVDVSACSGNPVTLSADAASWPAATVKWQVSTDGGTVFNDLPGATSRNLSLSATNALNGNKYRAIFTNSLGSSTSSVATLSVSTAPVVTTSPANQTVNDGQTATFTATATGTPTPAVQWYVSYNGGLSYAVLPGATSTTLSFTASTVLNGGVYAAAFTTGCATVLTTFATLTVNASPVKPAVTTQPSSVSVCPGQGQAMAQFQPQGPKLTGTGSVGNALQGQTVVLSADGSTALLAGINDNIEKGAVWVFTRAGGVWAQQGPKLVGSGPATFQGISAALSADGNTALIGGSAGGGGAWVWTRSAGVWTQQGGPLVPGGAVGFSATSTFGISAALSADGNTAAVGASYDNGIVGAVWVYTRSGGVWTQQGAKLAGTGGVGISGQGTSVALSADGNTLLVGGMFDNSNLGAAWVWTRQNGVWTQQGGKLVGTGSSGAANQGVRVALSSDGNTAAIGDFNDASPGGMWVWTRSGSVWTQQGPKHVGTGSVGNPHQGAAVALSGDGDTAISGGFADAGNIGAAWVFTRTLGVWTQQGAKLVGTGSTFGTIFPPQEGTSVALSTDGKTAIVGGIGDLGGGAAWIFARNQETFHANASGSPPPTVQWQVSTNGGSTFNDIAGATSLDLIVPADSSANGHEFRAVFSNSQGSVTSNAATFTVNEPPAITAQPADEAKSVGQTASFHAAASGNPTPSVQWQVSTRGVFPFADIAGATSTTLSFPVTDGDVGNRYRAVFTDTCGSATTSAALLKTSQVALNTAASPSNGGTVSPLLVAFYDTGSVVPIQATPNPGYVFTGWVGNAASPSAASTTITLNRSENVTATFANAVAPEALVVDPAAGAGSDGNGIFEPGETVTVEPSWKNFTVSPLGLSGTASGFAGPAGPSYTDSDTAASYGTIGAGATANCASNCYRMTVSAPATRPVSHWDAKFTETPSNTDVPKAWTLHIGDSFSDVPRSYPFYKKIETIFHNGITVGCTAATYCPFDAVPRSQMAIFLARGLAGTGKALPSSGTVGAPPEPYSCTPGGTSLFADVLPTDTFCKAVHFIAAQNVTTGCSAGHYCPNDLISRASMAIFVAKAIVAPLGGNGVPLTYGPDPVTGRSYSCAAGSPNLHFTDVFATDSYCKHVHFLWATNVIAGCSATTYCPNGDVHRDEMAKFLANAFGLLLYGP